MTRPTIPGRVTACLFLAIGFCFVACGTAPSSVSSPSAATGVYAPDLDEVTQGVVRELRNLGWDVVMAERISSGPFSVGARRIDIASIPDESVYVYVYASADLARNEASRLMPDGNLATEPGGGPLPRATWWYRQYIHYRDRIIARYGGCTATLRDTMVTLFGSPVVVADGIVACDLSP